MREQSDERRIGDSHNFLPGAMASRPAVSWNPNDRADFLTNGRGADLSNDLASLVHDTRNMVGAIDLYCDLLEEPGVLSSTFQHYAGELRLVSESSQRLLARLALLESIRNGEGETAILQNDTVSTMHATLSSGESISVAGPSYATSTYVPPTQEGLDLGPPADATEKQIANLAQEVRANLSLISALSGPGISVTLTLSGGERPVAMTAEDLTRVLVNLSRNAVEAMPAGGSIRIALEEATDHLSLTVTDTGTGIPNDALEEIFSAGYTTHAGLRSGSGFQQSGGVHRWPAQHRGLGLAIVRSLVGAAGGSVWAINRAGHSEVSTSTQLSGTAESSVHGATLVIEFPLTSHTATRDADMAQAS
jgi:signal transduction histidine kinase